MNIQIEKQFEREFEVLLKNKSLEEIKQVIITKRLDWYEKNKDKLNVKGTEVEKAFHILLFDYMQINPEDIKIVERIDNKIVFRSYNYCPILGACKKLGLDTKKVCKAINESSVNDFLKKINPKLEFGRSYEEIRPYKDYCKEWIELIE